MMGLIEPYKGKFSSIFLFGPPGAGKGMLGKFLSSSGSQYHLSSGQIFRSLPLNSPAGKLYYSYASRGELLPDEAMIEIWKYYVHGLIATNSYYPDSQDLLLDGIPRTLAQAKQLQEFVQVRHIIILEISNTKEMLRRMQKRARTEGRLDDIDMDTLKRQLTIYEEETNKIFEFYSPHLISRVNGAQRPLEVLRDVLARLSHLLSRGPITF